MTRAERIRAYSPKWEEFLDSSSLQDLRKAHGMKYDIIKMSTAVWLISFNEVPVFFFGIVKGSLLGYGMEMWFMPCKDTGRLFRKVLPFMRRALRRLIRVYGAAKSTVDADFVRGQRFVEYFGFQLAHKIDMGEGKAYLIYERRASWQ